jgi:outer membrane protein OmpA-like peptidoglycan-associated protein
VKTTLRPTACDCRDAIPLSINKYYHYGPAEAPRSYGKVQEITTTDKNSELSFAEEHNSAWYLLTMKLDGSLKFDIVPTDTSNDYDFLLYPYRDSSFCEKLLNRKIIPVRGNISNNAYHKNSGYTGLAVNAGQAFHQQGLGSPFSMPIEVKKGDQYMLVLDNVTPKGQGHHIYFNYFKRVEIRGVVVNEDNEPVVADVKLSDQAGRMVQQTTTDTMGIYEIKTGMVEDVNYSLTFSNDNSFIGTRLINTATLKESNSFPSIKTMLPRLKKGAKYPLGNINFHGNSPVMLSTAHPSVDALYQLMKKNKRMVIQIEGHVNAPYHGTYRNKESFPGQWQDLSDDRATSLRDSMLVRGIEIKRIQTIGLAATQMLYPYAKDEAEQSANRRVEIKVVSLRGE